MVSGRNERGIITEGLRMTAMRPVDLSGADRALLRNVVEAAAGAGDEWPGAPVAILRGVFGRTAVDRLVEGGWVVVWEGLATLTPWGAHAFPGGAVELHEKTENWPTWRRARTIMGDRFGPGVDLDPVPVADEGKGGDVEPIKLTCRRGVRRMTEGLVAAELRPLDRLIDDAEALRRAGSKERAGKLPRLREYKGRVLSKLAALA